MKKNILILFVSLASTTIQASVVNWTIDFFDQNNVSVGNGTFSYDLSTVDTFSFSDALEPGDHYQSFETTTAFTSLDWRFDNGVHWELGRYNRVWAYGSIWSSRFGSNPGPFHLGSQRFSPFIVFSSSTRVDEETYNGTWDQVAWVNGESVDGRGTWTATTVVPIPSSLLFFTSGLVAMLGSRRRVGSKVKLFS